MNRVEFNEKYCRAQASVDEERFNQIIAKSIDSNIGDGNPRGHRNLIIVMEELSELSKEVSKVLRDKGDRVGIVEEVADVICSIEYIKNILNISNSEINKAINVKLDRLWEIIEEQGYFQ